LAREYELLLISKTYIPPPPLVSQDCVIFMQQKKLDRPGQGRRRAGYQFAWPTYVDGNLCFQISTFTYLQLSNPFVYSDLKSAKDRMCYTMYV
jgi:hypothetical protein